jgi:transcriptional regulator with XRE-family HTH domain
MKCRLSQLRNEKGFSITELSTLSEVSASYIDEIESGKYNPTVNIACKLAKALGCTLNDLIDCE